MSNAFLPFSLFLKIDISYEIYTHNYKEYTCYRVMTLCKKCILGDMKCNYAAIFNIIPKIIEIHLYYRKY